MMTKGIIIAAAAFMFALTIGMLTAQSGNDRASSPTIPTLVLQLLPSLSFINDKTPPWLGETKCFRRDQTLVR